MKVSSSLIVALSLASSASAFVQKPALSLSPSTTALGASRDGSELSGMRKIGEAALAASLFFGLLPNAVHAIDYRLPPIDRSDPNRCTLKSSAMGQSNAARDSLFDLRECKLAGADAQGYDLSGVIMGKTDVSNANFAEAYFSKGYLQDSKFDGTDFSNAIVDRATFKGSSLRNAIFKNAVLTGSTFEDADVEGADFTEVAIGSFDLRSLCKNPTVKGTNAKTGEDTRMSLGCP
uniref:Thylakoid lumenal 17.4 kDa protein, chloroplastic n=1 Tax=Amphora coffeiformis TaxID=265554 RepID=A0A7S3PBN9_9STRA